MLEVNELSKRYNKQIVLNKISFTVAEPGLYIINGVNGSGKSTILKIIAGMIYKSGGEIKKDYSISYLPDRFTMPKLMRVKSYLGLVVGKHKSHLLDALMIEFNLENKLIGSLSKGNLQKVGLIQSLYNESDVYIYDEPIDGLDDASKRVFKAKIKEMIKDKIVIMALHNKTFFNDLKPRVYNLKDGVLNEKSDKKKRD